MEPRQRRCKRDLTRDRHPEIVQVWRDPHALVPAVDRESEARYLLLGAMDVRVVTAVFTVRMQAIRLISSRYASREKRRRYAEASRDGQSKRRHDARWPSHGSCASAARTADDSPSR